MAATDTRPQCRAGLRRLRPRPERHRLGPSRLSTLCGRGRGSWTSEKNRSARGSVGAFTSKSRADPMSTSTGKSTPRRTSATNPPRAGGTQRRRTVRGRRRPSGPAARRIAGRIAGCVRPLRFTSVGPEAVQTGARPLRRRPTAVRAKRARRPVVRTVLLVCRPHQGRS